MSTRITLVDGLWGHPSTDGLHTLDLRIQSELGIKPAVEEYKGLIYEADIYAGFSYGGSKIISAIREYKKPVRRVILLDAVTIWEDGLGQKTEWVIPDTVQRADCFYKWSWGFPWSSKILNESDRYQNHRTWWAWHTYFRESKTIQDKVIELIKQSL